jgi:L-arabinose isomerase
LETVGSEVVAGHWSDPEVQDRIGAWMRVARAWNDWQGAEFARFADNMRYVAVTEGDKVGAEARFGFSVNHYAVGDLVQHVTAVNDAAVTKLCAEYEELYSVAASLRKNAVRHDSLATELASNSACVPSSRMAILRALLPTFSTCTV